MDPQNQPMPMMPTSPVSPNTSPNTSQPTPTAPNKNDKKVGPIIATLIIVLILIIAALYLFAARINQPAIPTDNTPATTDSATTQSNAAGQSSSQTVQPVTGSSTDTTSLQSDLNTSTTGLDNQNF